LKVDPRSLFKRFFQNKNALKLNFANFYMEKGVEILAPMLAICLK
jgi:hypothetical protein